MFGPTDFSFVYDSVKFICHNTNSPEYPNRKVPDMTWLSRELSGTEDAAYIVTVSHIPPFSPLEFDRELAESYPLLLSRTPRMLLSLHGHVHQHLDCQPLKIKVAKAFTIHPLDTGIKSAYHFGDQFYLNRPECFPRGYYWWKSALRLHLATESSVTRELKNAGSIKAATGYIELNTNDLYLVSYVLNPTVLAITDIIKIGCGIRIHF